ncbi:MAG: hypothetical protein ORN49_02405 [Rhodobacteraceae bacterium]|nr:hypothetical protein [Paracoccaceae bacterium]
MIKARLKEQSFVTQSIWITLVLALVGALATGRWSLAFVAMATLILTLLPVLAEERFAIRLPVRFVGAIAVFLFATLFLGEEFDFYGRYWWWDIALHGGSAVGFGLVGFLFVFILFEGDRYAAPAWAVAFMSFCFAMMIGAIWEIFEFAMDQLFGMNMQKSGLLDTMGDLIVDMVGAALGGLSGFLYLKGRSLGGLTGVLQEFVLKNHRFFRKLRR